MRLPDVRLLDLPSDLLGVGLHGQIVVAREGGAAKRASAEHLSV